MARNRNNIFNAIATVPGRNEIDRRKRINPNMDPRGAAGPEMDQTGYGPGPSEQYGQGQYGPGWQSGQSTFIDQAGTGTYSTGETIWDYFGVENMNDLYDMWAGGSGFQDMNQYGSFMDWWNSMSGGLWSQGGLGGGMFQIEDAIGWSNPAYAGNTNPGMGGGTQGGAGDLGTGSSFAGGGMFSSQEGGGITNPFGAGWGPEGQLGEGGPSELNPDWNPWGSDCLAMYQTSGAVDDYETWANLYC